MTGQVLNNPVIITDANGVQRTIQLVGLIGEDGNIVETPNGNIAIDVQENGSIDSNNSTNTPLGIDGVFTGESTEVKDYGIIYVSTMSDVASATNGLIIQQSSDGINWDHTDEYTINASSAKTFSFQAALQYFRIVYTNGSTAQTYFRLQVILKKTNGKSSSHRIQDAIVDDDDAELVKSISTGKNPNGEFVNGQFTRNGNYRVSIDEYGDTPSIDSFDRLRVSNPYTIFDSKQLHDKQPLFWDEVTNGSASSTHNSINACVEMNVTANSDDYIVRQTKQRFNYQPGKGQLILLTFHALNVSGLIKRIGICESDTVSPTTIKNGVFFESNTVLSWNIAKNGTTTETVIQANWNNDTLDGSGDENNPSGVTLNLDSAQILIIDYEWLGVGRVRVGFVINGIIRYVHYFNHANDSSFSSVYMSTPNLPLRYSVETDGTNGGQLDHICSTVISEGGLDKTGVLRSIDTGTTHVDCNVDTTYAILGIKLKDSYSDITVIPESFSIINENNDDFRWSICVNPTIAGTFTYNDLTNSATQWARGSATNTISSEGLVIASGYASIDTLSAEQQLKTALTIGSLIDGTKDELVLTCTPLSAGADIQAALTFRELL